MNKFTLSLAGVGILVIVFGVAAFSSGLGYFLFDVESDEVGLKFDQNEIKEIMGPGIYSDYGFHNMYRNKKIETIKIRAIQFTAQDPEVLTQDKQRIGVIANGTAHRPGLDKPGILIDYWRYYKTYYVDDAKVVDLMQSLGGQAIKVCVPARTFDEHVAARDDLRECIDKELDKLTAGFGLSVANVVIPDIPISAEVRAQLDAITKARLDTQIANQAALQVMAEAERNAARERGAIIVEQGRIQEKARQDAATANLQKLAAEAQAVTIEANKNNELLTSQRDRDIAEVNRQVAITNAEATVAPELAKARMLQANGNYAELLEAQTMAGAYKETDKVIVLPAGSSPITVLGDSGKIMVNAP